MGVRDAAYGVFHPGWMGVGIAVGLGLAAGYGLVGLLLGVAGGWLGERL